MPSHQYCLRTHLSLLTAFLLSGYISVMIIASVTGMVTNTSGTEHYGSPAPTDNQPLPIQLSMSPNNDGDNEKGLQGDHALADSSMEDDSAVAISIDLL